jgi:hypothetical protein
MEDACDGRALRCGAGERHNHTRQGIVYSLRIKKIQLPR